MQRIFHISDVHFGLEDRQALVWLEQQIFDRRPEALIITGDFTMRARHGEYDRAAGWITGLGLPVWCEIGNHDMPYFNPVERVRAPFQRYERMLSRIAERTGVWRGVAGLVPVSLRTTRPFQKRWPWVDGWITDEALEACLAEIDALPDGTMALVCAHHPLPERGRDDKLLTYGGQKAMEALSHRPVAAVLSGHVHYPFDRTVDTGSGALRMIGAGTLSQRLRKAPPGFNELIWDGVALQLQERRFDLAEKKGWQKR
ncbi:MAG: metallophosphoesterase family protein [Sphingomonadaceae bacterium]